jgi:DnaJ family protein A protein 2
MGMTMVHIQMGPGMIMQSQMPCGACSGKGHMNGPACGACNGKCFTSEENILDVTIEPGMRVGEKLIFGGACSDHQDFAEAGDVHIQVSQADEEIPWKRDGTTLAATLAINLADSLLGSVKKIGNHPGFPEGCEIVVPPGSINAQVLIVKDAGMPIRGTNRKGDAHITLLVRLEAVETAAIQKHGVLLRSVLTTPV